MKVTKLFKCLMLSMLAATLMTPGSVLAEDKPADENLVKGLGYTVETGVGIAYSYGLQGSESDPGLGLLTDGKFSSSDSYKDAAWHKFYRGLSRSVTFELPQVKAVTGFMVSVLQTNSAGIQISNYYDLYVSENGADWMRVYTYDAADKTTYSGARRLKITAKDIGRFKAKYVKVKFRLEVNAFIDEIEVYGGETDGTEAAFVEYEDPYDYKNAYNTGVEGCRDIVLLYCGYKGKYDISFVQNTEEEMLYYCGYIAKNGEILDTMFDSFMFSALGNALPSGRVCNQGGDPPLLSDWQYYIDSIFDETYNCGAIERALERVKEAVGDKDYAMRLIINMPYPNLSQTQPFGDLNGDGKDEYCREKSDQLAIFGWFMDSVISKFEERGYKNIKLGGFYWESENIVTGRGEDEYGFIYSVSELAHARDTGFFWIPLLYANGMDKAYEMGFDCAMMQPNLSFIDYAKPEMLYELDESIRKYGLGIEMEIHWDAANPSAANNAKRIAQFYSYLDGGYYLGYMEGAAHSYYQNSNPGSFYVCGKSNSDSLRAIYDDVHAFIKHTYVPHIPAITSKEFKTEPGEKLYGYVGIKKGVYASALGEMKVEVSVMPEHGTLELNAKNGDFSYIPDSGFEGIDRFTVFAHNAFVETEPYVCEITVGNCEPSENSENSENITDDSEPISDVTDLPTAEETGSGSGNGNGINKENKNGWLIPAAGGTGAAVVIVAATVAMKEKRKKKNK